MLNHKELWRAIDRLAAEMGISVSALARLSGLDPTTFNNSKRISSEGKQRWPSTESIAKVLGATDSTLSHFVSLVESAEAEPRKSKPIRRRVSRAHPMAGGSARAGASGPTEIMAETAAD